MSEHTDMMIAGRALAPGLVIGGASRTDGCLWSRTTSSGIRLRRAATHRPSDGNRAGGFAGFRPPHRSRYDAKLAAIFRRTRPPQDPSLQQNPAAVEGSDQRSAGPGPRLPPVGTEIPEMAQPAQQQTAEDWRTFDGA